GKSARKRSHGSIAPSMRGSATSKRRSMAFWRRARKRSLPGVRSLNWRVCTRRR
ncbi:hypothetical protein, partial [Pseudomonas sp. HMWF006]|uniref:hypothetical protein n=1 Tax=Pseudomonas sp. HMWF006 TaxID=2056843 RepID=UPI003531A71E